MFAPNAIIEKLLQLKKHQAAMTLDALFCTDAIQLQSIEIWSILHYFRLSGIGIGESIVRRGLFDLARLRILDTFKIMNRRKGRPLWNYAPKSTPKMAQVLGVKLHRSENQDAIPLDGFTSAAKYRGAKHYAFLLRLGRSQLSRKKLGARLGVGGRSTFNYEIGKRLEVRPRLDRQKMGLADIDFAPEKRLKQNIFLEVEIVRELSETEYKEKYKDQDPAFSILWRQTVTESVYMPYTRFILARELGRGRTVYLCKQLTNEYLVA